MAFRKNNRTLILITSVFFSLFLGSAYADPMYEVVLKNKLGPSLHNVRITTNPAGEMLFNDSDNLTQVTLSDLLAGSGSGPANTDELDEGVTNLYFTQSRARSSITESITGIDYSNVTGDFSLTTGYTIPSTTQSSNWDTAYGWGDHSTEGYLTAETDPAIPTIAIGDILYGSNTDVISVLTAGAENEVLNISSGIPDWTNSPSVSNITIDQNINLVGVSQVPNPTPLEKVIEMSNWNDPDPGVSEEPWDVPATDNEFAVTLISDYGYNKKSAKLRFNNLGFSIPLDSNILGVELHINRRDAQDQVSPPYTWANMLEDWSIYLIKTGETGAGSNKAITSTYWTNTWTSISYGGSTDLWGTTLTPAEVNSSEFGVFIQVALDPYNPGLEQGDTGIAWIKDTQIDIYYTIDGGAVYVQNFNESTGKITSYAVIESVQHDNLFEIDAFNDEIWMRNSLFLSDDSDYISISDSGISVSDNVNTSLYIFNPSTTTPDSVVSNLRVEGGIFAYDSEPIGSGNTNLGGSLNSIGGNFSTVGGIYNTITTGNYNTVFGRGNENIDHDYNTLFGYGNEVSIGNHNTVFGVSNSIVSSAGTIFGSSCTIDTHLSGTTQGGTIVGGISSQSDGVSSVVLGDEHYNGSLTAGIFAGGHNTIDLTNDGYIGSDPSCADSVILGGFQNRIQAGAEKSAILSGDNTIISGIYSTAISPQSCRAYGDHSIVAGKYMGLDTTADYSFAYGEDVSPIQMISKDHAFMLYPKGTPGSLGINCVPSTGIEFEVTGDGKLSGNLEAAGNINSSAGTIQTGGITRISLTGDWSGNTIPSSKGGTDNTSYVNGDLLQGQTTPSNALSKLSSPITYGSTYFLTNTPGVGNTSEQSAWATPATVKTALSLNNVENIALSTWAGSSNITTLGTVATGTWSATAIAANKGGTGQTSYAIGDILYASSSSALSKLTVGTVGKILTSSGTIPQWSSDISPVNISSSGLIRTDNGTVGSNGYATTAGEIYAEGDIESDGNLYGLTLNTGQGANELYDMDQNVLTSSSPSFDKLSLTGTSAPTAYSGTSGRTDLYAYGLFSFYGGNDAYATGLRLSKARNGGLVSDGDALGSIIFSGHDGTDFNTYGAFIRAVVDGTTGATGDIPTRLDFFVRPDGSDANDETYCVRALSLKNSRLVEVENNFSCYGLTSPNLYTGTNGRTDLYGYGAVLARTTEGPGGSTLTFIKNRSTQGYPSNGDAIGRLDFKGRDGTDSESYMARILVSMSGTCSGAGDLPGALGIYVRPDGSNATDDATAIAILVNPTRQVDFTTDLASGYSATFSNSGNNANRSGIKIQSGENSPSGTNYTLRAYDGDGTEVGGLKFSSTTNWAAYNMSDATLKEDIQDTKLDAKSTINKVRVKDFRAKGSRTKQTGFIAQDLKVAFPEATMTINDYVVKDEDTGTTSVQPKEAIVPTALIPVLWDALQEQIAINDKQQQDIDRLKIEMLDMKRRLK